MNINNKSFILYAQRRNREPVVIKGRILVWHNNTYILHDNPDFNGARLNLDIYPFSYSWLIEVDPVNMHHPCVSCHGLIIDNSIIVPFSGNINLYDIYK